MLDPQSPASPWILAVAIVLLLVVLAIRAVRKDRLEYRRFKQFRSSKERQRMMRGWLLQSFVVFGAASALLLLLDWRYVLALLRATEQWIPLREAFGAAPGLAWGITIGVAVVLVGGTVLAVLAARKSGEVPVIGDIHALLPRNRRELVIAGALSINAGLVEELLFRLAVPAAIFGVFGNAIVAVVASVIFFGLLHIYQGVAGVIGATVIGGVLMALYLATGSIAVPIVAHALFDLRSLVLIPVVVYGVQRNTADWVPAPTPAVATVPEPAADAPAP
ncbi:MAG: type II CAAX endopeptidase family protein [Rhodoglobus sp.]